ncbi:hypothetical protein GCM10010387_49330 [Streptomyces inusitatus]|uniref:Uncharacterized protein n=1 Tax=Streptomyces inusitatus TaxID=68221 RepID=A0A918QHR9_9ACTN|nr:hypothetical protein [Streptomyces inusitatus]GGZ49049.1 hypothetical protein GCM10010387_49330 [Streptomyces inusitatus]
MVPVPEPRRCPRTLRGTAAIELTDELIALEWAAWAEIQARELTVETAWAVQWAITLAGLR